MPEQLLQLPLWVRFGASQKLAGLNAYSPLYLRNSNHDYGGGDFGDLFVLIEKAKETGFSVIQLLPLYDTGDNTSPYMPVSFFALNPIFLWIDDPIFNNLANKLKENQQHWTSQQTNSQINYQQMYDFKTAFLQEVYLSLKNNSNFVKYKDNITAEIKDYAKFCSLKQNQKTDWQKWETNKVTQNEDFYLFGQWLLTKQLKQVKEYADKHEIYLCLDKPLYLQLQSSDVWANQELFYLKKDGYSEFVSGCNNPSDPFGAQVWGHPVFQFTQKSIAIERYFIKSIAYLSQFCHVIRLDHVLALIWKYYLIDPNTQIGKHIKATGYQILQHIIDSFPNIHFIAEDSGFESEQEIDLPLQNLGLLGVRCLQWASQRNQNSNNYPYTTTIYASTHDTKSLINWYQTLDIDKLNFIALDLKNNKPSNPQQILNQVFSYLYQSSAQLVFVSLPDLLFDTRRINIPGTTNNYNWQKRMIRNIEEIDFSDINKLINKFRRNQLVLSPKLTVSKVVHPQIKNLSSKDKLELIVASNYKIGEFIVNTNLQYENGNSNWQELIFDVNGYWEVRNLDIKLYYLKISLTNCIKGNYELSLCVKFNNGELLNLYEYAKNLKINILQ